MADNSKKIQEELASVKALDKILSQTLDNRLKGAREANALQDDFIKKLREEKDISESLIDDINEYEEKMQDILESNTKGGKALKSQLDVIKQILKVEEARKIADEKIGGALNDQVDALESKIQSFPILGDTLAKSINFDKIKEGAGEMISKFTNGFTEASMAGQGFGGALKTALGGVSKGLTIATIKQGIFNAVAMINPYVLIAAAIIAVILLIKKLISIGMEFDQQTTDIARNFGISKDNAADMQRAMSQTAAISGETYVNSKNMLEAQGQLMEKLGGSAMYSGEMLKSQIQLTKFMGLSGDEAAKFQVMAAGAGQSTRDMQKEIAGAVHGFNKATGATIALKDVMKDIANVSDDVRANFGGNVKEMVAAVAQAKLLGTTVDKLADYTQGTLNMEQSLQKEMKLRVLTGKNINLDQVRRLKLMGDEAGAAKALTEQMGSLSDFQNMLPHQQRAYADALGMTQGEMLNMLEAGEMQKKLGVDLAKATMQDIQNNSMLSDQEKEKLIRQKEAQSAQEKMDESWQKLKDTLNSLISGPLGSLMEFLVDIVVFIVDIVNVILSPIVAIIDGIAKGAKAIANFFGFGDEEESGTNVGGYDTTVVNDAVINPAGDVISTSPDDFLIATKNPAGLADKVGSSAGSVAIDYDKLAAALGNQPLQVVIDGKVINNITRKQSMNKSYNKMMG